MENSYSITKKEKSFLPQVLTSVIGMGKPWYVPFSIFTKKMEISMGHFLYI